MSNSNSLRVLKTTKQTAQLGQGGEDLSYPEIARLIIEQDGVLGLLGRGLQTRVSFCGNLFRSNYRTRNIFSYPPFSF